MIEINCYDLRSAKFMIKTNCYGLGSVGCMKEINCYGLGAIGCLYDRNQLLRPELGSLYDIFIFFGHSGYLKPARIRILPPGSFAPGILIHIQQIRQNVYSSYHQDRYR